MDWIAAYLLLVRLKIRIKVGLVLQFLGVKKKIITEFSDQKSMAYIETLKTVPILVGNENDKLAIDVKYSGQFFSY